jgi:heptosyltransferase-2
VVRPDEIGDVVLTSPFLRELRHNLPAAWITLVVKPALANLVEHCPYVNEVVPYDSTTAGRPFALGQLWKAFNLGRRHLAKRAFHLACMPRWDVDYQCTTFLLYFSGARWRVGYSENVALHKKRANPGLHRLLTDPLEDAQLKHEVLRNLEVIRALGGRVENDDLELWIDEQDHAFAEQALRSASLQAGEVLVGLGPGGGNSPLKKWPTENFAELARRLHTRLRARVVLVGGPGEEHLTAQIGRVLGSSAIDLVGKATLRQTAALLQRCSLYIGNDYGPTHIAAAMGVPVIALFGPSCPHRFAPWSDSATVICLSLRCSPCSRLHHQDRCPVCILGQPRCMTDITVERVEREAVAHLARVRPCPRPPFLPGERRDDIPSHLPQTGGLDAHRPGQ